MLKTTLHYVDKVQQKEKKVESMKIIRQGEGKLEIRDKMDNDFKNHIRLEKISYNNLRTCFNSEDVCKANDLCVVNGYLLMPVYISDIQIVIKYKRQGIQLIKCPFYYNIKDKRLSVVGTTITDHNGGFSITTKRLFRMFKQKYHSWLRRKGDNDIEPHFTPSFLGFAFSEKKSTIETIIQYEGPIVSQGETEKFKKYQKNLMKNDYILKAIDTLYDIPTLYKDEKENILGRIYVAFFILYLFVPKKTIQTMEKVVEDYLYSKYWQIYRTRNRIKMYAKKHLIETDGGLLNVVKNLRNKTTFVFERELFNDVEKAFKAQVDIFEHVQTLLNFKIKEVNALSGVQNVEIQLNFDDYEIENIVQIGSPFFLFHSLDIFRLK